MVELTQQEKDIINGVVTNELGVVNPTVTKKIVDNLAVQMSGILNRNLINAVREHLVVANSVNTLSQAQEFLTKCLQTMEKDVIKYEKTVTDNTIEITNGISDINDDISTLTTSINDMMTKFDELQKENIKLLNVVPKEDVVTTSDPIFGKNTAVAEAHTKDVIKKVKKKLLPLIELPPKVELVVSDIVINDNNIAKPQKKKPPRKKNSGVIHRNLEQEHNDEKQESEKSNILATYLGMKFSDLVKVAKEKKIKIPPRSKKDDIAMLILGE